MQRYERCIVQKKGNSVDTLQLGLCYKMGWERKAERKKLQIKFLKWTLGDPNVHVIRENDSRLTLDWRRRIDKGNTK